MRAHVGAGAAGEVPLDRAGSHNSCADKRHITCIRTFAAQLPPSPHSLLVLGICSIDLTAMTHSRDFLQDLKCDTLIYYPVIYSPLYTFADGTASIGLLSNAIIYATDTNRAVVPTIDAIDSIKRVFHVNASVTASVSRPSGCILSPCLLAALYGGSRSGGGSS